MHTEIEQEQDTNNLLNNICEYMECDKTISEEFPILDDLILKLIESTVSVKQKDEDHRKLMGRVLDAIDKDNDFLEKKTELAECILMLNDNVLDGWNLLSPLNSKNRVLKEWDQPSPLQLNDIVLDEWDKPSPLELRIPSRSNRWSQGHELEPLCQNTVKVWSPEHNEINLELLDEYDELSSMVRNLDWDSAKLRLAPKSSLNFFSKTANQNAPEEDDVFDQKTNRESYI